MAHIKLLDVIDVGTGGYVNAISVEIAEDIEFTKIIDATYKNTEPVLLAQSRPEENCLALWYSMLPKRDGTGYHADLSNLYSRIKAFVDDNESDWFILEPKDQNLQDVIITEDGKDDVHTTSTAIGMQ